MHVTAEVVAFVHRRGGGREIPMPIRGAAGVSKHPAGYPCVTRSRRCRYRGVPNYLTYNTFRWKKMVGAAGFEPATPTMST